jgi:hypothetical protein
VFEVVQHEQHVTRPERSGDGVEQWFVGTIWHVDGGGDGGHDEVRISN